jgi:N-acetylneuraminic acid mutarotase
MPACPTVSRTSALRPSVEALEVRRLMHLGHGAGAHAEPVAFPANPAGSVFVDAGNAKAPFTDAAGATVWAVDAGAAGGKRVRGKFAVAGSDDDALFATRRQGKAFAYNVPASDGAYTLSLLFVDTLMRAGKRVFHVDAEGQRLEEGLDVFTRAGVPRTALVLTHDVSVTGGSFDLSLARVKGQAVLSAFSLVPAGSTGQPPPPPAPAAPAAPANLVASATPTLSVLLTWSDLSADEAGFEVQRSSNGGVTFLPLLTLPAGTTIHVDSNGLEHERAYEYRVRALGGAGGALASDWSNTSGATTPAFAEPVVPAAPSNLDAQAFGPTSVILTWTDNAPDETSLILERATPGGAFVPLATLPPDSTNHRDDTVAPGTAYRYRVRAANAAGESEPSNERTVTTPEEARVRWTAGADVPAALGEVAGGVIGGTLYLVGEGRDETFAYDIAADAWTSGLAERPHVGEHHAAEVVGGKLYLFGGFNGGSSGAVQIYDPATNAWTLGAPMPFSAGSASSALIGGRVYVAGGIVNFQPNVGGQTTDQAAVYDPAADQWNPIAPMPRGANHAASATDGVSLYVFGGRDGKGDVLNGFATVQVYDPATNIWRSSDDPGSGLAPLPRGRGGTGKAVFIGGEFYVMGGETKNGGGATANRVFSRVDVYDPARNAWRTAPDMPTPRHGIFPLLHGSRIYAVAGGTRAGNSQSTATEILELV